MTERDPGTARKLLPDEEAELPKKTPDDEGIDAAIEPAINFEETAGGKNLPEQLQVDDLSDSDHSDYTTSRFDPLDTRLDPRKVIQNAISLTKEPIKITWDDLNFSVQRKVKKQTVETQILKGCSGSAMPG